MCTPLNTQRIISHPEKDHTPDLENISFTDVAVDSVNDLLELLTALLSGYFGTLYRTKGFTRIGEQRTKFDIAENQYTVASAIRCPNQRL